MLTTYHPKPDDPIDDYQDTWYYAINESMRLGKVSSTIARKVREMNEVIKTHGGIADNLIVYRGLNYDGNNKYFADMKEGSSFIHKGFLSTTTKLSEAKTISCNYMTIKWTHPVRCIYLEAEHEVLACSGVKLTCTGLQMGKYGTHYSMNAESVNVDIEEDSSIDVDVDTNDYNKYYRHLIHKIGLIPQH